MEPLRKVKFWTMHMTALHTLGRDLATLQCIRVCRHGDYVSGSPVQVVRPQRQARRGVICR